MLLYHMSPSLKLGDALTPDYLMNGFLAEPFVQALEQSTDCFYGMILNGKYLEEVLRRIGFLGWANYAKWATEGAFEFIRKREFSESHSRMYCIYYYDNLSDCKKLYDYDWGSQSKEEQDKVHLFEVDLDDAAPQRRDMRIYDKAYRAMCESQDVQFVLDCARRYFRGEQTEDPVWEILSIENAKVVRDISDYIRSGAI